jgi:HD-like signal output (HDOD) protein
MNTSVTCPIADELSLAIERNELVLPAMPSWALKVQRMLDDFNVSAGQIVTAVSADPAFAAQLIKTANSAAYSGKPKINTVSAAVTRLGYKMLRNLIVSITINRLASFEKPFLKQHLAAYWEHSREVAATCYVLAKSQKHLNPDQAMLAGLIHDIGRLPLFMHIEKRNLQVNDAQLDTIIRKCSAQLGEKLLRIWDFPEELVEIPLAHEDIYRETESSRSGYADIVTVANMLTRATAKVVDWDNITAVRRIGIASDLYREFFDRFDKDLNAAREMLA